MDAKQVVDALAALAQETRLAIFKRLIEAGPEGVAAGRLAEELAVPPPTLSFHLGQLAQADLVAARRASRFIYYAASYRTMEALLAYLTANCCARAEPAAPCCGPSCTVEPVTQTLPEESKS